ncbi:MAG: VPLPA-CTERM sorting domain-containing protein [Sideroxyarcus sp.]|nr:VPLPA-CTERM sorting domain-containing protein [Sideroxyarcus sp.]
MFKSTVLCAILAMGTVGAASAATIDFDSVPNPTPTPLVIGVFEFDVARIVSGNCATTGGGCIALNKNETTTITRVGGGTFSLVSMWYQLLGNGTGEELRVTTTGPAGTFDLAGAHNVGIDYMFSSLFQNITSVTFADINGGDVRIDNLNLVPSQVPVPAAAGMLALALGGLGVAGRRKKA